MMGLSRLFHWIRFWHLQLAGTYQEARLPDVVRESIRRQQDNSEIVIGWVQLGIVVTFGTLYAFAPKAFGDNTAFAPVPIALLAYFGFTAVRLWLAHRRMVPYWFLCLSVVIDVALLLGLIWSFHLQYQQPPSFYLKAPTLLYVFIFIVLRALRFEAGFVILAGTVSALGWLFMVWYATADDVAITKDYVEYITSNRVLLGAEFDKVISIAFVTAILAFSLARAQRLLVRATLESTRAERLSRFVPNEIAEEVVQETHRDHGAHSTDGEVREASILFVDLEGFTALSEQLAPPEVIATLNDYFAAVAAPLERHGGVITQFQGDAILASFNVPRANEEHALDAVAAAKAIQRALAERRFGPSQARLRARVGINTGQVVGGLVGTPDRVGYTVHGDAVNLAARLENLNKRFGTYILVSGRTRELAGPTFDFEARGTVEVRGKRESVTIFSLAD